MKNKTGIILYVCMFAVMLALVACGGETPASSGAGANGPGTSAAGAGNEMNGALGGGEETFPSETPDEPAGIDLNANLVQGELAAVDADGMLLTLSSANGPVSVALEADTQILLETLEEDAVADEVEIQPADLAGYVGTQLVTCQGSFDAEGVFQAARVIIRNQ